MDACFAIVFCGVSLSLGLGIVSLFFAFLMDRRDPLPLMTSLLCRTVNVMVLLIFLCRIIEKGLGIRKLPLIVPLSPGIETIIHTVNPGFILLVFLISNLLAYHMGHLDETRFASSFCVMTVLGLYLFFTGGTPYYGIALCLFLNLIWVFLFMICRRLSHGHETVKKHFESIIDRQKEEMEQLEIQIRSLKRPRYYGDIRLSRAERELLDTVRTLKTINTKELACHMFRAESTIGNSIYNIRRKLDMTSRADLFAYVMMNIPEET